VSVSEFSFVHFIIHTFELTKLHISVLKGSEDGTLYLGLTVLLTCLLSCVQRRYGGQSPTI